MSSDLDTSMCSTGSESSVESEAEIRKEEDVEILEGASDVISISDAIVKDPDDRVIIEESYSKQKDDDDDDIQRVTLKINLVWKGDRLFRPARNSSKSSKAWEICLGQDKTGQLITEQTICDLCGKVQKHRNTSTNLQQHVQAKHAEWRGEQKTSLKETKLEGFFLTKQKKLIKKYRQDNLKQKKFNNTITEWIIKNKRLLKIVEDPKLVEAFQLADERLEVPYKLQRTVKKQYDEKKTETIKELKSVEWGTETSNTGFSTGGKSFIAVNFHRISEDFHMKKKLLTMLEMKVGKSAINYKKKSR